MQIKLTAKKIHWEALLEKYVWCLKTWKEHPFEQVEQIKDSYLQADHTLLLQYRVAEVQAYPSHSFF